MPDRYRKKPVIIEAMRLPDACPEGVDPSSDGYTRNLAAVQVLGWLSEHLGHISPEQAESGRKGWSIDPATGAVLIPTLEGVMSVSPGDYIIRGVQGEFYPCKSDIFEATYERVGGDERTDSVSEVRGDEAP